MQLCWASCSLACNHISFFKPCSLLLYVVLSKLLPTFCFFLCIHVLPHGPRKLLLIYAYVLRNCCGLIYYIWMAQVENFILIYTGRQNVLNGWSQWAFVAVFIPKHQMLRMYFCKNTIYFLSVVAVLLCHSVVLCLTFSSLQGRSEVVSVSFSDILYKK